MTDTPKFHPNERVDLGDIEAISDALVEDGKLHNRSIIRDSDAVFGGFYFELTSATNFQVARGAAQLPLGAPALHGQLTAEGTELQSVSFSGLAVTTWTVWIRHTRTEGQQENRVLWDPTGAQEVITAVNTRESSNWQIVVSQTTPGAEWAPLWEVAWDGSSLLTSTITDVRSLVFDASGSVYTGATLTTAPSGGDWGTGTDRNNDRGQYALSNMYEFCQMVLQKLQEIQTGDNLTDYPSNKWWTSTPDSLDNKLSLDGTLTKNIEGLVRIDDLTPMIFGTAGEIITLQGGTGPSITIGGADGECLSLDGGAAGDYPEFHITQRSSGAGAGRIRIEDFSNPTTEYFEITLDGVTKKTRLASEINGSGHINLEIGSDSFLLAEFRLDSNDQGLAMSGDVFPNVDNTGNLGKATHEWANANVRTVNTNTLTPLTALGSSLGQDGAGTRYATIVADDFIANDDITVRDRLGVEGNIAIETSAYIGYAAGTEDNTGSGNKNRLYGKNVPKAWGHISWTGAGPSVFTLEDSFGVNSITPIGASAQIIVNLSQAMTSSNFAVLCTQSTPPSTISIMYADINSVSQFTLKQRLAIGGTGNMDTEAGDVYFVVFGEQ